MTPITVVSIAIVLVLAHAGHTAIASGERLFRAIMRRCFVDPPIPSVAEYARRNKRQKRA